MRVARRPPNTLRFANVFFMVRDAEEERCVGLRMPEQGARRRTTGTI